MDDADMAVAQQERQLEATIRNRPRTATRIEPGQHCLACGEEIPKARRDIYKDRACLCVDCQEGAERVMR